MLINHISDWIQKIRKEVGSVSIIIVGKKTDFSNDRKISMEKAKKISEDIEPNGYVECSSKTGENIDKIFVLITKKIIKDILKKYL